MINYIRKYWQWIVLLLGTLTIQFLAPDTKILTIISLIVVLFVVWYRLTIESIKFFAENKAMRRIFAGPDDEFSVMERLGQTQFLGDIAKSIAMIIGAIILGVYVILV